MSRATWAAVLDVIVLRSMRIWCAVICGLLTIGVRFRSPEVHETPDAADRLPDVRMIWPSFTQSGATADAIMRIIRQLRTV